MNSFLIVSLIFILGLLFCTVLGGYCSFTEGFQNGKPSVTDVEKPPKNKDDSPGEISISSITGVSSTGVEKNKVYNKSTFDNYNHFTGDSHPTKFYGPNGESATVVNTNGTYTLLIVDSNGINHTYLTEKTISSSSPLSSSPSSSSASSLSASSSSASSSFTQNIYYGSNGGKAVVTTDNSGNYAILVTQPDKTVVMYTTRNVPNMASSMPTANSAFPSTSTSPSMAPAMAPAVPSTMPPPTSSYMQSSTPPTMPSSYNYSQSLPSGIPSSMIPPGQQDLYILKSQVVPPVCPACPTVNACPTENSKEKCPPCKPCGRCPEPSFECKKTYNYNSSGSGAENLPMPILNDFSTFGM